MRQDLVLIIQLDSEHRPRQDRNNLAFQRYALFCAHFAISQCQKLNYTSASNRSAEPGPEYLKDSEFSASQMIAESNKQFSCDSLDEGRGHRHRRHRHRLETTGVNVLLGALLR